MSIHKHAAIILLQTSTISTGIVLKVKYDMLRPTLPKLVFEPATYPFLTSVLNISQAFKYYTALKQQIFVLFGC